MTLSSNNLRELKNYWTPQSKMKEFLVLLLCLTVVSGSVLKADEDESQWKAWKDFHGKNYASEIEETARRVIWRDNLKKISEHNAQSLPHILAMNQFGDLTQDEFRTHYLGARRRFVMKKKRSLSAKLQPRGLPDTVDWRKEGYVTPVKNQGQCYSSWAFSTTGSLEGQHFRKTGQLVSLSEQNLVDCSKHYGNHGCQGGLMDNAFRYIKENGGIDTEASYPYKAENGPCRFKSNTVGATDTGFVSITGGEADLQHAVATIGTVSVAIDASHFSFQFYHSGVYDQPSCSSTKLDHGVLVVGYGTNQGKDYWLVKNSWGPGWGMEGYIMMSRNKNNQCGIATTASYPLV